MIVWEIALVSRKYMLRLCSDNSERTFNIHIYTHRFLRAMTVFGNVNNSVSLEFLCVGVCICSLQVSSSVPLSAFLKLLKYFTWMSVFIHGHHILPGARGGQIRVSGPLER